jgi:hypothetical protein
MAEFNCYRYCTFAFIAAVAADSQLRLALDIVTSSSIRSGFGGRSIFGTIVSHVSLSRGAVLQFRFR